MNLRHDAACARCGKPGRQYQLNALLQFDKKEPMVVLCNQCVHALQYADALTWEWFREFRDRLIASQDK
jgi:hypothetical protein